MKKSKKMLAAILCAAMASQGFVAAVNVSAATAESISIDFEEYEENALPGSSWSFSGKDKLPDGTQANDFFKVKTIRNADGEDTKALVFESQPGKTDEDEKYLFKDKAFAKYTFDKPITGNYIQADYDILVKKLDVPDNNYYEFINNGYVMSDTEGKQITRGGAPIGGDDAFYYAKSAIMGFPEYLTDSGNYNRRNNPRLSLNQMGDAGQWVNVKKIYNVKESTYSLWLDSKFKGTYALGIPTGNGISQNNGVIDGISAFYIGFLKDCINTFNVCAAVDNLKVTKLTDYVPGGMVSYDFETDEIGALPTGMAVNAYAKDSDGNWVDNNTFYKVVRTKGYDGTDTKALYFKSQPTQDVTYDYNTGECSVITFNFVAIKNKYVEVSYDVKIEKDTAANFTAGFLGCKEDGSVEGAWNLPVNTEWIYKDTDGYNWKIRKFLGNHGGAAVYNADGTSKWVRHTRVYDLENHTYTLYVNGIETLKDQPMISAANNKITETSEAVSIVRFNVQSDLRGINNSASISYYIDNVYAKPVDYRYMPKNFSFNFDFENETIGKLPTGWAADSKVTDVAGEKFFNIQETTDKNGLTTKALKFNSNPDTESYTFNDSPNVQYKNLNIESGIIETSFDVKVEKMGDREGSTSFAGGAIFADASGAKETVWGMPTNQVDTYNHHGTKTYNNMGARTKIFAADSEGNYNVPKWTSFRFVYNLNNRTYSVYVDEVLKQTDVKMKGNYIGSSEYADSVATMASDLVFGTARGSLQAGDEIAWYIDNVSIKEIIPEKVDNIYVSAAGDDANSGYADDQPVTLEKAKKLAKDATLYNDTVTVHIEEGTYTGTLNLTANDSPADGKKIIYKAEGNVVFTGEYAISADKFAKTELMGGKVYSADISNIADSFNKKADFEFGRRDNALYYGLIQNNTLMSLAKYPNFGYIETSNADVSLSGDAEYTAEITIPADKAEKWANAKDVYVEGYFWNNWGFMGKNASVSGEKLVLSNLSDIYNFPRYTVTNLLEELDIPGEYYIDRDAKKLYYYPIEGSLEGISLVTDENTKISLNGAKNIELDGINVKNTKGNAYKIVNSNNITIKNVEITNIYAPYAIDISSSTNVTVDSSKLHDLPAGGIYAAGGNALNDFARGEIKIVNSEFYNFAQERKTYYPAVYLYGCGNTVSNCVIHDAPHSAIIFTGNDHVIEHCDISNVVTESLDAGAIYGGRSWVNAGTEIRYNKFHNIKRYPVGSDNSKVIGIFFDDMLCGNKVIGNIFDKVSTPVVVSGGKGVEITDNIITNCNRGVIYTNRNYTATDRSRYEEFKSKYFVDANGATNSTYDTWLEKYPYLALIEDSTDFDNLVTDGKISGNVITGTDAADFKAVSSLSQMFFETEGDYAGLNTYENNTVSADASYEGTATWAKISAEIAKVAANISKTTVANARISLISAESIDDGVQFIWFNHSGIGLEDLIIADNSEFNNPVTVHSNFNGVVVNGLERGKTYYWKVVATDSFGNTATSEVAQFKLDALTIGNIALDKVPAAGETVTATIPVDMADSTNGAVIAAYKADGKTIAVGTTEIVNGTTTVAVEIPADASGDIKGEFYFWTGLDTMVPLADAIKNITK